MGKEPQELDTELCELHVEEDSLVRQMVEHDTEGEPFVAAHHQEWQKDLVQVGGEKSALASSQEG